MVTLVAQRHAQARPGPAALAARVPVVPVARALVALAARVPVARVAGRVVARAVAGGAVARPRRRRALSAKKCVQVGQ
jgi:hypothetical protein